MPAAGRLRQNNRPDTIRSPARIFCGRSGSAGDSFGIAQSEIFPDDEIPGSSKPSGGSLPADAEIDQDAALALAMEKAGVPEKDTYNVKVERDRENDIPIFQVSLKQSTGIMTLKSP